MTEINIGNTPTEYYTHISNKKYDLYQIFAALPSILPTPPITTNYFTIISGTKYDLSQIFARQSPIPPTPPFITGYNTTISGTNYDLSQLFIFYPIDVSSGSNIKLYYNPDKSYYIHFSPGTCEYNYIRNTTINGYLIGGGGSGSYGSINFAADPKGGGGGGGGGVVYIDSLSVTNVYPVNITIGHGGAQPSTDVSGNGTDSSLTYNTTPYISYGGLGGSVNYSNMGKQGGGNNQGGVGGLGGVGTQIQGGNPGFDGTFGGGGGGCEGGDINNNPSSPPVDIRGGGGGGAGINGYDISYSSIIPSGAGGQYSTGGNYGGGAGGLQGSDGSPAPPGTYGGGGGGAGGTDMTLHRFLGGNGGDGLGLIKFNY
jgi:hypothetical protein